MSAQSIPVALEEAYVSIREPFVLGHRPALDGFRGIAILAVLAVHTNHLFGWSLLRGGSIGVDLFFVLSGFLITSILLSEWNQTGDISFRNFYLRRCLRLVPALLLLVLAVHLASGFLFSAEEASQTRKASPIALLYITDFAIAFDPKIQLGALRHTWSLAMEEQFYLLWPPLLLVFLKSGVSRKHLLLLTLAMAFLVAIHRAALYQPGSAVARTYYGFDTRADALLIGCAAGMAVSWGFMSGMNNAIIAGVLLIALLLFASDYASPFMHLGGFTVLAFAGALVVIKSATVETGLLRRILETSLLVWIGRISYGLYLWHYPVFKSVKYLNASAPVKLLCGLLVTFAIASLSFYVLESPLLRLKKRFA